VLTDHWSSEKAHYHPGEPVAQTQYVRDSMPDVKPLPRWFRAANHAVRVMSRIGLAMGPVCVLTMPGRRSGKPRSTPVSPLTVSGGRYVVAGRPDSDWASNVRAAGRAQLSRGRRREDVTLTEVTDRKLKEQVMRAYPREVPRGAPMFVQFGVASSTDPDAFVAAASQVAVFEIRPAPPAQ
jgi:deazaflavin-dependent oxidoreductase (nitroreductase family)